MQGNKCVNIDFTAFPSKLGTCRKSVHPVKTKTKRLDSKCKFGCQENNLLLYHVYTQQRKVCWTKDGTERVLPDMAPFTNVGVVYKDKVSLKGMGFLFFVWPVVQYIWKLHKHSVKTAVQMLSGGSSIDKAQFRPSDLIMLKILLVQIESWKRAWLSWTMLKFKTLLFRMASNGTLMSRQHLTKVMCGSVSFVP